MRITIIVFERKSSWFSEQSSYIRQLHERQSQVTNVKLEVENMKSSTIQSGGTWLCFSFFSNPHFPAIPMKTFQPQAVNMLISLPCCLFHRRFTVSWQPAFKTTPGEGERAWRPQIQIRAKILTSIRASIRFCILLISGMSWILPGI